MGLQPNSDQDGSSNPKTVHPTISVFKAQTAVAAKTYDLSIMEIITNHLGPRSKDSAFTIFNKVSAAVNFDQLAHLSTCLETIETP
jgi:hypothetical protein